MVYDRLGLKTTDPQITETVVNRFIDDALHELEVVADWPWLQTSENLAVTASTDTYAVASNWRRTVQLRISDGYSLRQVSITDLDDTYSDRERGRPEAFAIFGDQVIVRPWPDTSYTVKHRYLKKEPALTTDSGATGTPLVPVEYHPAVAEKVVVLAARRLREESRGTAAEAAYQQWIAKMRDDTRRSRANGRVRVRPGGQ